MTWQIDTSDVGRAIRGLDETDDRLDPVAQDAIADMATVVRDGIRREGRRHRVTGEMLERVAITDQRRAGMRSSATVRAGGIVAPRIIAGQVPHVIRARRARALAFGAPAVSFAEGVKHPGAPPDPFVARGVRAANLDRIADNAAATAADRIAEAVDGG